MRELKFRHIFTSIGSSSNETSGPVPTALDNGLFDKYGVKLENIFIRGSAQNLFTLVSLNAPDLDDMARRITPRTRAIAAAKCRSTSM